jgi:hypothetical protein
MKATIQVPNPVVFQQVEIEGTPEEIAEFVKALGKDAPGLLPWGQVATVPSMWVLPDVCPLDGGAHRYPTIWMSVSPAACEKCGRQAAQVSTFQVTLNPGTQWAGEREIFLPTTTTTVVVQEPADDQYFWRGEGP